MKKMLVVLRGRGDTGKTTTIRMIRVLFLKEYPKSQQQKFGRYSPENVVILALPSGIKIGICSYGDSVKHLERPLAWFVEQQCHVIICASRVNGSRTANYVNSFEQNGFALFPIDKSPEANSANYEKENSRAAKEIIQLVTREIYK